MVAVDLQRHREEDVHHLLTAHLQTEKSHLLGHGDVPRNIQGEGGFVTARWSPDYDHIPGFETAGQFVEVTEGGHYPGASTTLDLLVVVDRVGDIAGQRGAWALAGELALENLKVVELGHAIAFHLGSGFKYTSRCFPSPCGLTLRTTPGSLLRRLGFLFAASKPKREAAERIRPACSWYSS